MFVYASSFAIARVNQMPLYFLDQHNLSGVFQLTSVIVNETTYEKFDGVIKSSEFRAHTGYHAYMFNISRDRDTKLQAFTFSWKYFADFELDIRSEFRFKPDILTTADTILRAKLDKLGTVRSSTTLIGVHIRRGDYLDKNWVLMGTLQPPLSFTTRLWIITSRNLVKLSCLCLVLMVSYG